MFLRHFDFFTRVSFFFSCREISRGASRSVGGRHLSHSSPNVFPQDHKFTDRTIEAISTLGVIYPGCWNIRSDILVLTRAVHEVLTLYTHPLTVGWSNVEFVTPYHLLSGSIERTKLNSYTGVPGTPRGTYVGGTYFIYTPTYNRMVKCRVCNPVPSTIRKHRAHAIKFLHGSARDATEPMLDSVI